MTSDRVLSALRSRSRWHPGEIAFWAVALASFFLFPDRHSLLNEIAILALFALSLDLLLGYAGIVSLGHAAFLGIADVAGKYYVPSLGAFVIYAVMIAVLVLRPQGLFARAR